MDALTRFHARWIQADNGCKIWQGKPDRSGYGRFYDGDRDLLAHRWIFQRMNGYLPAVVMHKCDTPLCVNWEDCLLPGTSLDNHRDMVRKGRHIQGERVCSAKLTVADVQRIRELYESGLMSVSELAIAYGMSKSTISKTVAHKIWKSVA